MHHVPVGAAIYDISIIIEPLINVIAVQNIRVKSDTVSIVPSHLVNG